MPAERMHYLQIAAAVLGMVIVVRIAWVMLYNRAATWKHRFFGAGYWPGNFVPTVAGSLVVGWAGMRGIVTLATAYALPAGFPHRDLALLCAFTVVVGTLVLQGLTLAPADPTCWVSPATARSSAKCAARRTCWRWWRWRSSRPTAPTPPARCATNSSPRN